jgi:acyl transferase domain-containing protein/NAD(P)H-dependent flavin oxidoreductase YrpB (nitropropane dioxygenase family)
MVQAVEALGVAENGELRDVSIIGLSPLERPDPGLVAALCEAGALGVLDLGRDAARASRALAAVAARVRDRFGVRVPEGVALEAGALPAAVRVVIVTSADEVAQFAGRAVLVQVTSVAAARAALAAGAAGLIGKGAEAGGRVGEETAFVLVQQLVELGAPLWVQGGIGAHTAAACIAGGARGVVLDSQLALVRESSLGAEVRRAIGLMDGSETTIVAGHRVYTRPDLPVAALASNPIGVDEIRARLGGDDLARNLLPLGQEAALARGFADRCKTAAGVVRAVRAAMTDHLALATELRPLAPDAPLAAAHGVRYPIAQGPMSRVSDRAGFALAVADGGGLPFLALSLMSGPETRALLEETRALLGDRPWGVGILGFVPPELRDAQLEVIREIPPAIALIAGGRPSQATPLEAQGTATYLHVPSPGLLEMFLRDGARRFVFEGRECGGHVGPRSSFALWEAQLDKLLAHPACGEVSVLFAGGIHDARSAAMVAALAAPLAARGAKIGVLMGTAYLFTHEAVASGAIMPGFQQAAIACEHTVLLETAPGHATRCADTAFPTAFADEAQRLIAAGVDPKARWAALEQLNLGRLRLAAKGLRRAGAALEAVDARVQHDEGMFMIGQVAALRHATCSIAELHRQVSEDGTALLTATRAAATPTAAAPCDVAIVGLAAIFADAPDTDTYWRNIVSGKNAIREVPAERWSIADYYDPKATGADVNGKTPSKWGGFLDDVRFDPLAYGIPPRSLASIEPVQLLALEIARRALADAGYVERAFDRARTSVIFGAEAGTDLASAYGFRAMYPHYVGPMPAALDDALPSLTEDSFPGVLSNVIAGRIANRLDLGGVNYTVDAACAASLAALDLAVKELTLGTSDMVLCGGADLHNSINDYLLFASVHALSPTGQCHTFDARADGIVLGEGVACVVLKRLADAERDGDRIYAVIKAVAGGSDGKSLGLTAPRKEGQVRALERAYAQAGVSPAAVGLVEAHGTGTAVGDRTELATLTEVYARAGATPGACVLGSVKSQIGHTKCAAGMAGLIKTALAIHHGVLPPNATLTSPSPAWQPASSPFRFLDGAQPWTAAARVGAVSAFGFGGTNFHAVLASHDARAPEQAWSSELFLFRGETPAAATRAVEQALAAIAPGRRLRDLARAVCAAGSGPVQVAVVADDLDDLRAKLYVARELRADRRGVFVAGAVHGPVAFLCPGQGSQKVGMLADLFMTFPRLGHVLALGAPWLARMFPPAVFTDAARAAQAAALTDTRVAQPALGIAGLAVADLLASFGVAPAFAAGHSYGELVALCLAGAIRADELLPLSEARGQAILAAAAGGDPGTMVAVAADAAQVAPIIAACADVVIANHNGPTQCVLSGPSAAIEAAIAAVTAAGLTAKKFPVACAFHSPVVAGARTALAAALAPLQIAAPRVPVWANATATPYPASAHGVRATLAAQVAEPVRFAAQIEAMYAAGARIFVECGPGQVLTRLAGEILGARPHVAVACDAGTGTGVRQFLRALGALAVAGVPVDADALFADRDAAIIELEPPRAPTGPSTTWLVNGHRARPEQAPAARPDQPARAPKAPTTEMIAMPTKVVPLTTISTHAAGAAPAARDRDAVVLEYLRGVRELVAAERDVMLSYLGAAPALAYAAPVAHATLPAAAAVPVPVPLIDVVEVVEVAAVAAAPAVLDPMQLVLGIVSERTGYPIDTLGPDLDLEADLSIDSIKRIEIIGELAERLGLNVQGGGAGDDKIVEELAARKTLRSLVAWLNDRIGAAPGPSAPAEAAPAPPVAAPAAAVAPDIKRYVLALRDAPAPANGHHSFADLHFAIVDDGRGIAAALAASLAAEGAHARVVDGHASLEGAPLDALIHLGALAEAPATDGTAALVALFDQVRAAALAGATTILVATAGGGRFGAATLIGAGATGLIKTIALEYPGARARTIDLDPRAPIEALAAAVRVELSTDDGLVEVGHADGARVTRAVVPAPLAARATGALLDSAAVVLLTGGARGITGQLAVALARRYRCQLELVGRSPLPLAEDPALAGAADAPALRRALLERGEVREPAQIEAACARVLADREIRATLAAIEATGARVRYHAVDVRDASFGAVIDDIYARHGRLDGVIHGAGVLEDKLVRHKTPASFARVVSTKLAGAATLAARLRDDTRFVALFASIAGAFGNRGQVDYAAANDALDVLATALARRIHGRVVAIDWGPWAGAGMVSPELEREYARRGVGLVMPDRGIDALLAELAADARDAQVVLMAGDPRALHAPPAPGPRVERAPRSQIRLQHLDA